MIYSSFGYQPKAMSKHGMTSRQASQVKRGGHLREQIFSNQFTDESMNMISKNVNYSGSSSDCFINREEYLYIINDLNVSSGKTSVKGGSTYQFHLGRIPVLVNYETIEIKKTITAESRGKYQTCFKSSIDTTEQLTILQSYDFWNRYLGKGDILAIDAYSKWHFFAMKDVLNLLINPHHINWRFLPTGRIKGDLLFSDGTKLSGITFEHRFEKNQSVLGAHGGTTGIKCFLPWLLNHIDNKIIIPKMMV